MPISRLSRLLIRKDLRHDVSGMAAVEFVMLLPMLLLVFFGLVEVSSGVAVSRKVNIATRTLSDLISQADQKDPTTLLIAIQDVDVTNAVTIANLVMTPYDSSPMKVKISQVSIDATVTPTKIKVEWSTAHNDTAHACTDKIVVPAGLAVANQKIYLIMSEVTYPYTPAIGHDFKLSFAPPTFNLADRTFTRPRQSTSIAYATAPTKNCP